MSAGQCNPLEFRLLGTIEVREGGRAIALGQHQQRAVLAILVLHAGEVVSANRLIEELWNGAPPPRAAKTGAVYLSRLRKALAVIGADALIATVDHGYALHADPDRVDVCVFERLLDEGRRA